jgi:hypothetical protein
MLLLVSCAHCGAAMFLSDRIHVAEAQLAEHFRHCQPQLFSGQTAPALKELVEHVSFRR